jgi:hypothetical protein
MSSERNSSNEPRRFASGSDGRWHEVDSIVDYTSPRAYYQARCGAHVPCRTADVFKGSAAPAMLCGACKTATPS